MNDFLPTILGGILAGLVGVITTFLSDHLRRKKEKAERKESKVQNLKTIFSHISRLAVITDVGVDYENTTISKEVMFSGFKTREDLFGHTITFYQASLDMADNIKLMEKIGNIQSRTTEDDISQILSEATMELNEFCDRYLEKK